MRRELVDQRVVVAMDEVVVVLHADDLGDARAPASIWADVTLLRPRWRIRPCRCSSASAVNCSSIEPSLGP